MATKINGTQYDDIVDLAGSSYYRNGKKAGLLTNSTNGDDNISTGIWQRHDQRGRR